MLIHTLPKNDGERAALARSLQLTEFVFTPVRDIPTYLKKKNCILPQGVPVSGFPYSSTEKTDKFITENVSIRSFLSAIANTESKLYQPGQGAYYTCNYGIVCNGLARYAFGIPYRVSTKCWESIPGMRRVADRGCYKAEDIRLLDVLYAVGEGRNHVALITDILKDENGVIREIEVSDAARPSCRRVRFDVEDFFEKWAVVITVDVFEFCGVDVGIHFGLLVKPHPESHPNEACRTDDDKRHFPTPELRDQRNRERSGERADGRTRVEDRRRKSTVFLREVFGRNLDCGGEVACFTDGENGTARKEEPDGRRHAHHADESDRLERGRTYAARGMKACAERPDENRPQIPLACSEPIDELAGEKVRQRIYDRKDTGNGAVVVVAPSEHRRDEIFVGERQNLTIEIIDRCRKKEKRANYPTEI